MHVSNESIAIIKFNIVHAITVLARRVIGCHGDGDGEAKFYTIDTFLFRLEVPKMSEFLEN